MLVFFFQLTWADVTFLSVSDWPAYGKIEINWEPVPKLKALLDRVAAEPKIAEWIKKRPKTEY